MAATTRIEHDLLGDKEIPSEAYYGVQTARALENFHISGVELRLYPNVIKAFARVKMAANPRPRRAAKPWYSPTRLCATSGAVRRSVGPATWD